MRFSTSFSFNSPKLLSQPNGSGKFILPLFITNGFFYDAYGIMTVLNCFQFYLYAFTFLRIKFGLFVERNFPYLFATECLKVQRKNFVVHLEIQLYDNFSMLRTQKVNIQLFVFCLYSFMNNVTIQEKKTLSHFKRQRFTSFNMIYINKLIKLNHNQIQFGLQFWSFYELINSSIYHALLSMSAFFAEI